MLIGKGGQATSSLCTADAASITIRERDLCGDLMGGMSFTEYFYFLVTGHQAGEQQRYFLDLLLVAIAEHGLTPTAQAARMTYDADPQSLQAAVAAGILGCGSVVLGTADACARVLLQGQKRIDAGEQPEAVARDMAQRCREAGERFPGFGHPLHHPVDPRTERVLELADQRGVDGAYLRLARAFRPAVQAVWGKPLPMNVSMPIAAVLMDLDFPPAMVKAIPILARTAGILAHVAEEQENPIGFLMAFHAEEAVDYVPAGDNGRDT